MAFCPNCGNELKSGVKFCTNCGKPVESRPQATPNPQPKPSQTTNTTTKTKTKSKKPIKIGPIIIIIIFVFVLIGIIGGRIQEERNSDQYNGDYTYDELDQLTTDDILDSAAYTSVFTDRGIYDESALAGYGLSSGEFVLVDETQGMIDKQELGYKDDTVEVFVETVYYPVSSYSSDEKTQLLDAFKSEFAVGEALDFVTITYDMDDNYLKVKILMEDMDKGKNVQAAADAGLIQISDTGATSLSYSVSRDGLLAAGYIKK